MLGYILRLYRDNGKENGNDRDYGGQVLFVLVALFSISQPAVGRRPQGPSECQGLGFRVYWGYIGILEENRNYYSRLGYRVYLSYSQNFLHSLMINGHRFLIKDHSRDCTKLQAGPLCALFRAGSPGTANIDSCSYANYSGLHRT